MATPTPTYFTYATPHGPITAGINSLKTGVTRLAFGRVTMEGIEARTELGNLLGNQLLAYFSGKSHVIDVPLDMHGSEFQVKVWEAIRSIPFGETRTASQLAEELGKPGSHRMVGRAIAQNPLPLLIPDHRVVRADGTPLGVGFAAHIREGLLNFERHQ